MTPFGMTPFEWPVRRVGERVRTRFTTLRPELSYDPASNALSVSLGAHNRATDPALVGRDILRVEKEQGRLLYQFDDPFFAAWIRRTIARE